MVNELQDTDKVALHFSKSELKLILNCMFKKRQAPVRVDHGLYGYEIVCSHCSGLLRKLPNYDVEEVLVILTQPLYYVGEYCKHCGQTLDLSPIEKFKEKVRIIWDNE